MPQTPREGGTGAVTCGLWIEGPQSRVLDNEVETGAGEPARPGCGIAISRGPSSIVEGNRVAGDGIAVAIGIEILDSEDVVVTGNAIEDLAVGVSYERSTGRSSGNVIRSVDVPETGGEEGGDDRGPNTGGRP